MNQKPKLLFLSLIIPFFLVLYGMQNLFLSLGFCVEENIIGIEEGLLNGEQAKKIQRCDRFNIKSGLIPRIFFLSNLYEKLNSPDIPTDGKLSNTLDRMSRVLLALKIYSFTNAFLVLIALSSIAAILHSAWFAVFLGNSVHLISIPLSLKNLGTSLLVMRFGSKTIGMGLFFINFLFLGLAIFSIFYLTKKLKNRESKYLKLYNSSNSEDETSNVQLPGRSVAFFSVISSGIRMMFHFIIIILVGFLLGNLVYIPLFTLQKLYSVQFGFSLALLVIFLSLFYIRNYYKIGKENEASFFSNLLVSFSFLQYRLVRNSLLIAMSTIVVILFILFLLSILFFNTYLLQNFKFIEQSINL
ncbi:MAG: hypothetical protein H7A25_18270 [Leptospiraceae bacterium]|nr:hypothetical protein [Leptospiraceae bacterium]